MRIRRVAGLFVNCLVVVALVVFGMMAFQQLRKPGFAKAEASPNGLEFKLSGVDFSASSKTVLLALDRDCPYCQREAGFHSRLAEEARKQGARVIALFQRDFDQADDYLARNNISVSQKILVKLKALRIDAVPAIIVLNNRGQAIAKWDGSTSEGLQNYIIGMLGKSEEAIRNEESPFLIAGNPKVISIIDLNDFSSRWAAHQVILVDIDARDEFKLNHLDGAINIPGDEIYARAQDELDPASLIAVFSRHKEQRDANGASVNLKLAGFDNVKWLRADLNELQANGLKLVVGSAEGR